MSKANAKQRQKPPKLVISQFFKLIAKGVIFLVEAIAVVVFDVVFLSIFS